MPKDKGAALNKRVWSLFHRAGFETKPNPDALEEYVVKLSDGRPRPVDLFARVTTLDVTIVGSNKARKKFHSFSAYIHDLVQLKEAAGAHCALFVSGEKLVLERERNYAASNGVQIWDQRELSYYEAVADALGYYAKFEIIHALGLTTSEEKLKISVVGVKVEQPNRKATIKTEMYLFTLPAEMLLKTCVVLRKAKGSAGAYQRILSKKRLPNIGSFVRTPDALIPTNIVVHLGEECLIEGITTDLKDAKGKKVTLSREDQQLALVTVPLKYGSLELIDGQHRLFGFAYADDPTRQNFDLVVLGLRSMEETRRSRTFVAINDNARRVDPNLVAYLRYTDDERICQEDPTLMAIKIVVELNKLSPFEDSIKLLDVGDQRLTLRGLSGYDLKGLVGARGLLRKHYPDNSSEQYVRALRMYFSAVKASFPDEWKDPDTFIIATNRGITAFLKLLRSILKTEDGQITVTIAKKYIAALEQHWSGTWETTELKASYVGSQGWKRFHHEMVKSIRKQFKNFLE